MLGNGIGRASKLQILVALARRQVNPQLVSKVFLKSSKVSRAAWASGARKRIRSSRLHLYFVQMLKALASLISFFERSVAGQSHRLCTFEHVLNLKVPVRARCMRALTYSA